jgi:IclR helix-turn-helix domain
MPRMTQKQLKEQISEHLLDAAQQVEYGAWPEATKVLNHASATITAQRHLGVQGLRVQRRSGVVKDPSLSQSLVNGFNILGLYTKEGMLLGIADIAERLQMSRGTVHRYCQSLVRLGQLEQAPGSRKYRRPQTA